jgi:hypothetical protein
MTILIGISIGYVFAVIIGHIAIQFFVDGMWKSIGWIPNVNSGRPEYHHPRLIGVIERTLYVASLQMGKPEFIGVWLALKVAGQWKRWETSGSIAGNIVEGRVFYNIFLIGSGLSVAYAVGGAKMIEYFNASQWTYLAVLPLAILFGTAVLQILSYWWKPKKAKTTDTNP